MTPRNTPDIFWKDWLPGDPDPGLLKAIPKWNRPARWRALGHDDQQVWGEVRTQGSLHYRVGYHLSTRRSGCTCSRPEKPCVHILSLITLHLDPGCDDLFEAPVPDWLQPAFWDSRSTGETSPKTSRSVLAGNRWNEMQDGYAWLEAWMTDRTREGWRLGIQPPATHIEDAAARLVNFRLPGPARMLRALPGPDSPWETRTGRLSRTLAVLLTACRTFRQGPDAHPASWPHLLQFSGQTLRKEHVLQQQPGVRDTWLVLAAPESESEGLRQRATWLWGSRSRRFALMLDYAWQRQPMARGYAPGALLDGPLHFYPGDSALRALPGPDMSVLHLSKSLPDPAHPHCPALFDDLASRLAADPWTHPLPVWMAGTLRQTAKDHWTLSDIHGHTLPVFTIGSQAEYLQAFRGVGGLCWAGLWHGSRLRLLSVTDRESVTPIPDTGE